MSDQQSNRASVPKVKFTGIGVVLMPGTPEHAEALAKIQAAAEAKKQKAKEAEKQ